MQRINDDEVDLDPEDPSHLLRCLDLFEDELKDLEKERGFSISRLKKVALDRLKNLDKEGIKPMRELIQESKQVVKGKIAGVTKEEQRIKLADAIEVGTRSLSLSLSLYFFLIAPFLPFPFLPLLNSALSSSSSMS